MLRVATEADKAYVCASHLKHYHRGHPSKYVPDRVYFRGQGHVLDYLWAHATVTLACFPEAPEEILGYIVVEPVGEALALHYIYVRHSCRLRHVGRQLLDGVAGDHKLLIATHVTDEFNSLRHHAGARRVVYDPYLLPALIRGAD